MTRASRRPGGRITGVLMGMLCPILLSACDETAQETGPVAAADAPSDPEQRQVFRSPVERDVPAPELFESTGVGIWDGRPTLGGVWIAHPLAERPERVQIVNLKTEATVTGALFKRDTALSGPAIQISSDAARTIGIVPGEATPILIVALRREVVEGPVIAESETEDPAVDDTAELPSDGTQTDDETSAAEETEIADDSAPGEAESDVELASSTENSETALTGDDDAVDAPDALAPEITAAVNEADETAETGTEPSPLASTEAAADTEADIAEEAAPETITTAEAPVATELPQPSQRDTLPDIAPAPPPPSETTATEVETEVEAEVEAETAPVDDPDVFDPNESAQTATDSDPSASAATEPQDASLPRDDAAISAAPQAALERPYIQVGLFGVKGNAEALQRRLERDGMTVRLIERRAGGRLFTRVLVGPAQTAEELQSMLEDIRRRGFTDAIPVAG